MLWFALSEPISGRLCDSPPVETVSTLAMVICLPSPPAPPGPPAPPP